MKPKKLILSRKGFDSANRCVAALAPYFLMNDTMFSLPIPDDRSITSPTGTCATVMST